MSENERVLTFGETAQATYHARGGRGCWCNRDLSTTGCSRDGTSKLAKVYEEKASRLLEGVHRTLYPLKMPNMFATAGVLQLRPGSKSVTYSLAGHPALMRYCSQSARDRGIRFSKP